MSRLVILRHGQSTWNELNLFTGWVDVELTEKGRSEAAEAGKLLAGAGLLPDVLHTSLLQRAINTANITLDVCERSWIPVRRNWRLNERHYGNLQGLNKAETLEKYGPGQLHAWRRSYDTPPPSIDAGSQYDNRGDARYPIDAVVPETECLKDVVVRMMPYWWDAIAPDLQRFETVLVVAHGNSLRALMMELDGISEADIAEVNIPTGAPRVYEFDNQLNVLKADYLGDPDAVAARAAAVAAQANRK